MMMISAMSAIPQDIIMGEIGSGVVVIVGGLDEWYIGIAACQQRNCVGIADGPS